MEDAFANETPKKGLGFIGVLVFILLFVLMSIGIDGDEYLQHKELEIPVWFFYLVFAIDALLLLSLLLVFFYRKIGVFLFPLLIIVHFFLHNYYLSTFLYADVTSLFLFSSFGLLVILPKWKFFK